MIYKLLTDNGLWKFVMKTSCFWNEFIVFSGIFCIVLCEIIENMKNTLKVVFHAWIPKQNFFPEICSQKCCQTSIFEILSVDLSFFWFNILLVALACLLYFLSHCTARFNIFTEWADKLPQALSSSWSGFSLCLQLG